MVNLIEKSKIVRKKVLDLSYEKQMGHMGGTYSCVELLVSLYYGEILRFDPMSPRDKNRDRFIMSKGHACLALYSILSDLGFISPSVLESYCDDGGLGGQLDITIPGVDWNTGSLGHSVGICCGIALASRLNNSSVKAYTLVGDAECAEGSVWESLAYAGENQLNIVVIVDRNRLSVTEVLGNESFFKSYPTFLRSFGWDFYDIDGHSFDQILKTLKSCKDSKRPSMVIANTIKGKGVSFMENQIGWHNGAVTKEQHSRAMEEL